MFSLRLPKSKSRSSVAESPALDNPPTIQAAARRANSPPPVSTAPRVPPRVPPKPPSLIKVRRTRVQLPLSWPRLGLLALITTVLVFAWIKRPVIVSQASLAVEHVPNFYALVSAVSTQFIDTFSMTIFFGCLALFFAAGLASSMILRRSKQRSRRRLLASPLPSNSTLLSPLPPGKYHAFHSHPWGADEGTHKLVVALSSHLRDHHQCQSWIDAEYLQGNLASKISQGINDSAVFIPYLCKDYNDKIVQGEQGTSFNWCHFEWRAGFNIRKPHKMLIVILEKEFKDTSKWAPVIHGAKGGDLYVDFTDETKLAEAAEQIAKELSKLI